MNRTLSVAEAKAHFSECLKEAEDGEPVMITRHGKLVAGIVSAEDVERIRQLRALGPEGGLASIVGSFADVPDFPEQLDQIVRSRGSRATPDFDAD